MEDYFCNKKESEKEKTKNYYQINKEKLKKPEKLRESYRNLLEEEKLKKEIMLTLETEIRQTQIEIAKWFI